LDSELIPHRRRLVRRPTIVLEFSASRRLQCWWGIWSVILALVLWIATGVPWWIRLILVSASALLWHAGWRWLRTPVNGVRRLIWDGAGRWQLQEPAGAACYVRLAALPRQFGPLMWLPLKSDRRSYLICIDGRYAEPRAFCALKARLRLDFHRLDTGVDNG
jgi:hypothetical protein